MEAKSKRRPLWADLPAETQAGIEQLVGGRVVSAVNRPGGFSAGFASRLELANGSRVFVKAIDAERWPMHADWHRTEARIVGALPTGVPAPRLLGFAEEAGWVALAFEDVDGREPAQPWRAEELDRVLDALGDLVRGLTPSPVDRPRDHPRLGGWRTITDDESLARRLAEIDRWPADRLEHLVALEADGLEAARGDTLVHFDAFFHNILLTDDEVLFVDWAHARLGAPFVDLVLLLSSAAAGGIDPDAIVTEHPLTAEVDPRAITGVLAAQAGFATLGALGSPVPGMEPVRDAKLALARSALTWLKTRITRAG